MCSSTYCIKIVLNQGVGLLCHVQEGGQHPTPDVLLYVRTGRRVLSKDEQAERCIHLQQHCQICDCVFCKPLSNLVVFFMPQWVCLYACTRILVYDHIQDVVIKWNLINHIPIYMITTIPRFLIGCLQVYLLCFVCLETKMLVFMCHRILDQDSANTWSKPGSRSACKHTNCHANTQHCRMWSNMMTCSKMNLSFLMFNLALCPLHAYCLGDVKMMSDEDNDNLMIIWTSFFYITNLIIKWVSTGLLKPLNHSFSMMQGQFCAGKSELLLLF